MIFLIGTWWIFAILAGIAFLLLIANFVNLARGTQGVASGMGLHALLGGITAVLGIPAVIGFIGWLVQN